MIFTNNLPANPDRLILTRGGALTLVSLKYNVRGPGRVKSPGSSVEKPTRWKGDNPDRKFYGQRSSRSGRCRGESRQRASASTLLQTRDFRPGKGLARRCADFREIWGGEEAPRAREMKFCGVYFERKLSSVCRLRFSLSLMTRDFVVVTEAVCLHDEGFFNCVSLFSGLESGLEYENISDVENFLRVLK